MTLTALLFVCVVICLVVPIAAQAPQKLTVAAAADLQPFLTELKSDFEARSGAELTPVYGSSGSLFVQIENGAPFDVFMSADSSYPQRLVKAHRADPRSLYRYALGRLVLWTPPGSALDVKNLGLKALLDPAVHKIAIANPQHAPYGSAALAALKTARLYDQLGAKLVLGENAMQAAQFVRSGNAQVGLLPLSLVLALNQGTYAEVPPESYPSIEQWMVVLTGSKNTTLAEQFIQYMKQTGALMLLKKHGFVTPKSLLSKGDGR